MSRALTILALCTAFTAAGCGVEPDATQTEDALKKKKCWSNSDCGSLEFCNTEAAASCSSRGVCSPRGINLFCSNLYVPVCGCDGNTYPNGCQAHKAGASVAHNSNADCPSLEYCATPVGQCGATGACKPRGINLFCSNIYQPVCGCDGNTYGNTCLAQKAGAAIDHTGACACDFKGTNVDGDTLAEQAWMDQSQTFFYTFTGNGMVVNNSGTFAVDIAPPCTRGTPFACKIAIRHETGTFTTSGTTVTLSYDNGNTATFTAETDCHNTWELIGHDFNQAMTLTVSTIFPTP
jgi:hypothetical protein